MSNTTIRPLVLTDLTEATITGQGAFDVLMRSARAHLDQEFQQNRIRGPEYSQVFLGSITAVLAQAVDFLLNKDKAANEAELIQAQIDKVRAEVTLAEQQARNAAVEERVLEAQVCKLKAEYDLLLEGRTKSAAEVALLNQRVASERAQTVASGVDPDSVIGRQKALYVAQTDGFTRDAEHKVAKLLADTWGLRRTTDEATQANTANRLDDATIGMAVSRLLAGVNIS